MLEGVLELSVLLNVSEPVEPRESQPPEEKVANQSGGQTAQCSACALLHLHVVVAHLEKLLPHLEKDTEQARHRVAAQIDQCVLDAEVSLLCETTMVVEVLSGEVVGG